MAKPDRTLSIRDMQNLQRLKLHNGEAKKKLGAMKKLAVNKRAISMPFALPKSEKKKNYRVNVWVYFYLRIFYFLSIRYPRVAAHS